MGHTCEKESRLASWKPASAQQWEQHGGRNVLNVPAGEYMSNSKPQAMAAMHGENT